MVGLNLYLMRTNNGKLQNFMQPIGLGKEQKRKSEKIKNLMIQYYDRNSINKSYEKNVINYGKSKENEYLIVQNLILLKYF